MNLKLLLGLLFIVWRSAAAEEYTNHWRESEDIANVDFCSHDGFKNATTCLCNVDYQGPSCLTRKCRNFGFDGNLNRNPVKVDRCVCPPGFLGRNCEPVSCVPGKDQLYNSLKSERTISLLASYNTKMQATWNSSGDIGKLICNKKEYGRNFNYNFDNGNFFTRLDAESCSKQLDDYLTADPCQDDNGNPGECAPLDINNLYSLVQYSPPNSIIFVVTNMGVVSNTVELTEKIVATSIANRIQINVLVYNNTNFFSSDDGLVYLSKIASDTFGTFVLPSFKPSNGDQYNIVNALLENWDQGFQATKVFTNTVKTLPVDMSQDLYVAAQTDYETDLTFNFDPLPTVIQKTSFWKLYKLTAESYPSLLSISNQTPNTPIFVYTSGGLIAYSAFTSDAVGNSMVVDAAYSVSVVYSAYSMVLRLETGTGAVSFDEGYRTIGTPNTIALGNSFTNRFACQFNFMIDAACTSVGASVVNVVNSQKDSVSFPVYCASTSFANSIYNDFVSPTASRFPSKYSQSISKDVACSSEIGHEQYGGRTFVIIAENSNDTRGKFSSADNVFRNKNSFFYPLSDFLGQPAYQSQPRYSNFLSVLTNGEKYDKYQSLGYGTFMTMVMDATSKPLPHADGPFSVKDILTNAIQSATDYSDIFMIINYNMTVSDKDSIAIKTALSKQKCKLFVLFVQTYTTYDSSVYTFMNDLSISSGGVAIRLNSYEDLSAFFNTYFPVLVANDIVAKAYSSNARAGIALSNVQLLPQQDYYLLLTNEDAMEDGPAPVAVTVNGATVSSVSSIGELQLFVVTPKTAGEYNVLIAGLAQISNAILYANTKSSDFISLSFVDSKNVNRNDVEYGAGKFTPVFYSSSPFDSGSSIAITYSDPANPAKPIYNSSIVEFNKCDGFTAYKWTTNLDWVCSDSGGLYHFKIDKKSAAGNSITRTFPITCLGANSGGCLNGGSSNDGGVCSCPLEWSGSNCQTPNCLNGGNVTTANLCSCIPAFMGDFCEISISECENSPSQPDYRSEIASLVIVADVNALTFGGLNNDFGVTGVPITVILYGDESGPRIVQSTTNSQHLVEVLKKRDPPSPSSTTVSPSTAPAQSDMYKALNLALDNQLSNRAFYVVYTSNADVPVDSDFLIRLAVRRAEIRVLSVAGTESQNSQTLSLVGNGIPLAVTGASDFQNYLTTYIGPLFQTLGYNASVPQRVFNVFKTDSLTGPITITIPQDPQFDNAVADIFVHVYNGIMDNKIIDTIGEFMRVYHKTYIAKDGITFKLDTSGSNGYYAIEIVRYLKTAYGFNYDNLNGANETVNAGVTVNKDNTLHIYTTPYDEISAADPANFPFLSIRKIVGDGSLSNSTTVAFTRKNGSCFFQYYTILDVCSETGTIGYQVQLTTRASETQNRQQQFVLTCFKTTYQDGLTACHGHGSPYDTCACDKNYTGIDCTEPVCQHGGVRDMSICRCPVNFYGLLCELKFDLTPVRVSAFIIDLLGTDGYAFNQSIASIGAYQKAFSYTHYLMLIGNLKENNPSYEFQQYADDTTLKTQTDKFWNLRMPSSGISDVSSALTAISTSYQNMKAKFTASLSLNIFYVTQNGLSDADKANVANALIGLGVFTKGSIAYSTFSKDVDPSVITNLQPFSTNAKGVRDWYGGVMEMIAETQNNAGAVIPTKPATMKCVYPLQTNIRVAIDRSLSTTAGIDTSLDNFLKNFQLGFNYIESDIDRCSADPLPTFYTERTALTAFPYYDSVVQAAKFCPAQYASMISYPVTGKNPTPNYNNPKYIPALGKQINSATCNCNRFSDDKTLKIVLWLPRAAIPSNETYVASLKLNTTNAYHFVVPFYDMTDTDNDLYYQILKDQQSGAKGADHYLLPNAATSANLQADVIDVLYNRICESAGVDPTAVPPSVLGDNIENRYYDYYH